MSVQPDFAEFLLARPRTPAADLTHGLAAGWPVTVAYIERIVPLGLTLIWSVALVSGAFWNRATGAGDGFTRYQRAAWPMEVAIVAAIVAQVAAWRGWSWWLRLLLHAGWIVLAIWARMRLP